MKTYIWWILEIKSNKVLFLQIKVVSLLIIKKVCDNNKIIKEIDWK